MKLFIKNMVSPRCKMMVKAQLESCGIKYISVELGLVVTLKELSVLEINKLRSGLQECRLDLLDNKRSILSEQVRNVIIEMIHYTDELPTQNYSAYIGGKLKYDYTYLANVFSEVNDITIREFIILHKIERVKELILDNDLNITEIANKLGYSSSAHLSNQFKNITGLTPLAFKCSKSKNRRGNLENV